MLNIKKLVKDFDYIGEFLDSDDLLELFSWMAFENFKELDDYLKDIDDRFISDRIAELSDAKIDAYHYKLREWVVDNYSFVEDAIREFGVDARKPDFHKMIQMGQYLAYSNEFQTMVSDFGQYINEKYKF